jgi:hypothetical protein
LIEKERELAIGDRLVGKQLRNELLVRGGQTKVRTAAIFQTEELCAHDASFLRE